MGGASDYRPTAAAMNLSDVGATKRCLVKRSEAGANLARPRLTPADRRRSREDHSAFRRFPAPGADARAHDHRGAVRRAELFALSYDRGQSGVLHLLGDLRVGSER